MLELFSFRVSHYSEKIRWMLDACDADYHETRWTPFFHVLPALKQGRRGTTVPILKTPQGYVQDSTRILLWLDQHQPGFGLLPKAAGARREVLEIEERFDRVGAHVIRFAYSAALEDRAAVVDVWTLDATPLQKQVISRSYPLLRAAFSRLVAITPDKVAQSRQRIGEALDFLDTRLADGRRYLVGDTLTAADITAAALLAPLASPDEHEVYSRADFRAGLAPLVAEWNERPALRWVRERYRTDRHAG